MLYATLALCSTLAALLVYRYDLYEREPWYMVVLMAGAGAGAMWLLNFAEPYTLMLLRTQSIPAIAAVAATHEELTRLILVGGLALLAPHQLNDPIDGLVYGSIVGLGMAVTESVGVIGTLPDGITVLPPSELVRLLGHLVLGGITGYAIGPARLGQSGWPLWLAGCLTFTIFWHLAWDWIAFTAQARGSMAVWETAAGITLMLMGLLVFGALVARGSGHSRAAVAPRSTRRVWGWPFSIWMDTK